jgi:hypothetical protein
MVVSLSYGCGLGKVVGVEDVASFVTCDLS